MNLSKKDILDLAERHTDLGHEKRNDCFLRQLELAMESPGTPLPQAAGKGNHPMADLMSLYRFVDNDKIPLHLLRDIRARMVVDTLPEDTDVMVVHDVSLLDFSHQNAKTDRRPIGDGRGMGYEYVCCAAVDPESASMLGVLHDTVIHAKGPDDVEQMDYDYEPLFEGLSPEEKQNLQENHRHQMAVHVNGLASRLADRHIIHVADREFDDIFVMDRCVEMKDDFVIRSMANRNVQVPHADWIPTQALTNKQTGHSLPSGGVYVNLERFVESVPLQPYKSLPLDKRGRVTDPRRADRIAHLSIGTYPVRLYRQARRNNRYYKPPRPIELQMVIIRETDPPPGVTPLVWVLFTTLPVETEEQLAYIGHLYELRWKIEDFFKLLKSGYRIEKHRFFDANKTAKLLVVLTLAAMTLFHLKADLGLPPGGYLDDEGYKRLKQAYRDVDNPDIDLEWRLLGFIAKSGGWLGRRNDPLGPTILMRGLIQVLAILDAASRHGPLIEEALKNPDVLRKLICV
ncbi:MAG: transposase [Armatimonadetes bacterium]|nr:transposase [Armatimonadota bacterium]